MDKEPGSGGGLALFYAEDSLGSLLRRKNEVLNCFCFLSTGQSIGCPVTNNQRARILLSAADSLIRMAMHQFGPWNTLDATHMSYLAPIMLAISLRTETEIERANPDRSGSLKDI